MKELKDMTEREILVWMMGEIRHIKKVLTNHLNHHEKQDDRRWKIYVGLFLTTIGAIAAALLA